jgi:hypothetical protein
MAQRDWIDYLPEEQRKQRASERKRLRQMQILRERRTWLLACLGVYIVWCLSLLIQGKDFAFALALIPLISMPAIAWLAWWLVYKEFHD